MSGPARGADGSARGLFKLRMGGLVVGSEDRGLIKILADESLSRHRAVRLAVNVAAGDLDHVVFYFLIVQTNRL